MIAHIDSSLLIRQMTVSDMPLCRYLVSEAGWNQTDRDWLRMLELEPEGCFVAEKNQIPVATTTTCCLGDCGWIAMVLVDQRFRNQGIAKQLLEHAITYLESKNMPTIRLDATALGQGLYKKLGFQDEYEVVRYWRDPLIKTFAKAALSIPEHEVFNDDILNLDRTVTATERGALLKKLGQQSAFLIKHFEGKIVGYATSRRGISAVQMGPVVALTEQAGGDLMHQLMSGFLGDRIFVDIPTKNIFAVSWAESNDFVKQRTFMRMCRGERIQDSPQFIWASFGPEKG